jgi:hypothetical protein
LIAQSQPLKSQDSAINLKPSKPKHNDDSLDFQFCKMFVNLYKMASRKKFSQLPFPCRAHWNKYKDVMSSDAIEGEPSNFGNYSIFSPSMPALDNLSQPIFQSILNSNDSSYALSPKSHNDPRNPLR